MTIDQKKQLEQQLWNIADSLRGKMNADEFRDYCQGGCLRTQDLLQKSWIWSDFPLIFVKYTQYSPQIMKKSASNQLSLATQVCHLLQTSP
ncbi:type I restriction-modification system subunit M N-terminal domain-containing protein [Candidatus Venteria ishoeyi]|nr:type I restriction-modification system subunit M N-terminal domain-containing protein [Candidatus Venteria ishoeyi]MDM8545220.1 type I restriction-modification system subunit M N-terminal domain-containing protein [Candidatus Venteria ishoeyi]